MFTISLLKKLKLKYLDIFKNFYYNLMKTPINTDQIACSTEAHSVPPLITRITMRVFQRF